jgi:23S rRNA U2552 (ribose-2'-O)-methylase RlmE/FtsJ
MQMDTTQKRLIKESKILMEIMSGEDRMYYLERMWDLYLDVYVRTPARGRGRKRKNTPLDKMKAYELCSELTKIFGH